MQSSKGISVYVAWQLWMIGQAFDTIWFLVKSYIFDNNTDTWLSNTHLVCDVSTALSCTSCTPVLLEKNVVSKAKCSNYIEKIDALTLELTAGKSRLSAIILGADSGIRFEMN